MPIHGYFELESAGVGTEVWMKALPKTPIEHLEDKILQAQWHRRTGSWVILLSSSAGKTGLDIISNIPTTSSPEIIALFAVSAGLFIGVRRFLDGYRGAREAATVLEQKQRLATARADLVLASL